MSPATAAPATSSISSNAFVAIFWGGLACGVLDITQACIAWGIQNHVPPQRIFQSVASGLIGPKSFQGGATTAALGLFLHFLIAFIWAVIFYMASRQIGFLTERPVIAGLLYGEFVWVMMNCVVVPLSAIHRWPPRFDPASIITGPILHPVLVGLPIALAVKKWAPLK
ncbi:MAG TPA: hypothetical protein VIB39_12390 [Candidatus Angelobacter sp.]|jgi:uncharacterized membrane protein YagU involved in acid resistance